MDEEPPIFLTEDELDRLLGIIEAQEAGPGRKRCDRLEGELLRAVIVPRDQIPKDTVTMNSRVVFEDETSGEISEVTLVYPADADIRAGRLSILAPVGSALLGLRAGQSIDWRLPNGEQRRYRIIAVPYQPEAAGALG